MEIKVYLTAGHDRMYTSSLKNRRTTMNHHEILNMITEIDELFEHYINSGMKKEFADTAHSMSVVITHLAHINHPDNITTDERNSLLEEAHEIKNNVHNWFK